MSPRLSRAGEEALWIAVAAVVVTVVVIAVITFLPTLSLYVSGK